MEQRSTGLLRIPFVHRCTLEFEGSASTSAFMVNINVLGAYIAAADLPALGHKVKCRFRIPGNEIEACTDGVVAWLNPRQQHPIHSLPPGFGIKFENLSDANRRRIESLVMEYVARSAFPSREPS